LDKHLPGARATLSAGVSDEDLANFEEVIGQPLPEDVRQSWLIHDGRRPIPDDLLGEYFSGGIFGAPGLLFGQELLPLLSKDSLSGHSALLEWTFWSKPGVRSAQGQDEPPMRSTRAALPSPSGWSVADLPTEAGFPSSWTAT
jgi:hypothetical protein